VPAWTLLSAGGWLEPEPDSGADVSYRFTNDQNIPPHAQAWFTMKFEPGTFAMPAPTPLFWIQTFGPLAPLVVLGIVLLLAFAARAVAWSDARGRPWFLAQFDPPKNMSPRMAAQILRTPATRELAGALADAQDQTVSRATRQSKLIAASKVGGRTGRLGDWPRAISGYLAAGERRTQLARGMRRVPRGFVRDLFIAAPLALTIVQWGLVRQLSHQAELSVVWWPVAFVTVSTAISAVIVWIALSVRPLTRRGALVKQHLLGIGAYADRTRLLARGRTDDPLLPYAVLTAPPRTAGAGVVALIVGEIGAAGASTGWRTGEFLTWPRTLVRVVSILLVVVAIAVSIALPTPYPSSSPYSSYRGDLSGNFHTTVQSIDAAAVLTRTTEGVARVDVTEQLTVDFDASGSSAGQFVQQWPNTSGGQDLGLQVEAVTFNGRDVPFVTQQDYDTLLLRTTLVEVLSGPQDVQINYSITSAAIATEYDGSVVDSVRWAAMLDGWEYNAQWGDSLPPDSIRLSFSLATDLANLVTASGWISKDTSSAAAARDWVPSMVPFDDAESVGGTQSHVLDLSRDESGGWPLDFTVDDVGAHVVFPAGTFTGPDLAADRLARFQQNAPMLTVLVLGILGFGLGLAGALQGAARARRAFSSGLFRDLVRWLAPAATLATTILFVWTSAEMPTDHKFFAALGLSTIAALFGCTAGLILTRASRGRKFAAG